LQNERPEPSYSVSHARTRFPEIVRLTATGSVRAAKIRQLAKRLAFTSLSILDTSSVARGTSSAPQLQRPPNCHGDRRDRGEVFPHRRTHRPVHPDKLHLHHSSLASAFRLPTANVEGESFCTATIRSKVDEAIKLKVVLKIKPNGRIRSPFRALSESMVKKFRELPLADERFHRPATISLILGADGYLKVIQPGMVVEVLPVAQKTVFGLILFGACTQA